MGKGADEMRHREDHSHNGGVRRKTLNMENQSADEIQREIERTRAEMDQTICEIQSRLSTDKLMDQAMDSLRTAVSEGTPRLLDAVKRNPIPVSLVALGVGWLIYRNMRKDSYEAATYYGGSPMESDLGDATPGVYYEGRGMIQKGKEKIKNTASHLAEAAKDKAAHLAQEAKCKATGMAGHIAEAARERTGQLTQQAKEKTSAIAQQAKEKTMGIVSQAREKTAELASGVLDKTSHAASQIAHQACSQASHLSSAAIEQTRRFGTQIRTSAVNQGRRANDQFWHQVDDNPMAVGAIALALGVAVGLILPETGKENQLLGPARDNLLNKAKEKGREALEKVQNVASATQQAVTQELEKQNLSFKSQGFGSGDHSKDKSSDFEGMLKAPAGDDISVGQQQGKI